MEPRLGPLGLEAVIALAVATVDVDRAGRSVGLAFRPAPPDGLLGARGVATQLPSGRTLLLLEPATEGRLAAFLARHGEGLAAAYLLAAGASGPVPGPRRLATALGRPGGLVAGARPGDPVVIVVD